MKAAPSIVVAGDVTIDWYSLATPAENRDDADRHPNWRLRPGLRMTALAGGAWLLADMVRAATGELVLSQAQPRLADTPPTDVLHSIAELAEYPRDGSPDAQKE